MKMKEYKKLIALKMERMEVILGFLKTIVYIFILIGVFFTNKMWL